MTLTRAEYEQRRLDFTKHFLKFALERREEMFGKITDGRLMLDFIWRGTFAAAKLWDEFIAAGGIDFEPDPRPAAEILRDLAALLESARGPEK